MEFKKPKSLAEAIMNCLAYADIFDHALTSEEIQRYLIGYSAKHKAVKGETDRLLAQREGVASEGGFFYLAGRQNLAELRKHRESNSIKLWRSARKYGRWIANLPFVRMVAVTGSLANNSVEFENDIDFLIVTQPGFLWLSRAFIILLTRITRPFGSTICANYLLANDALELPERDLFTAQELVRMIPLSGLDIYQLMRSQNSWTSDFLPNAKGAPSHQTSEKRQTRYLQTLGEILLNTRFGRRLELWEMRRKVKKLYAQTNGSQEVEFSAQKCKGHVDQHATRTMEEFLERTQKLSTDYT